MTCKRLKLLFVIPAIISMAMVAGCAGNNEKIVKSGDTIKVDYIGTFPDGIVFDTSIEKVAKESGVYNEYRTYEPLEFTVGAGQMIKGFDSAVIGMKEGDTKNITLSPVEAYGEWNPDLVQPVSLEQLKANNITPTVNMTLYTSNGMEVRVVSIDEQNGTVAIDMNNPMAGKTLLFSITVKEIVPAK
ncbi:peptidylprolyl isomerase [Methanocella sp. CWC-04]|uniref:Peptidyl-prolyl cis-trans isomerase n=1 Tax=Methanooceanicella nereidis TaxID=2052831 RepID=A0AAP2RCT2_9EURY|nr:peptidylprolyl isomerase [Methanocella sp. CWC-04]MCD1294953.1 peptidylprolyl isomerase [Methanocella sp. CWC-04]